MPTNTHVFDTKLSKRMQADFVNKPVYKSFVNEEERANLEYGEAVQRPYKGLMRSQSYTRNGSLTFQNITETAETMSIGTIKSVPFQVDKFDIVQSSYREIAEWSELATDTLKDKVDGNILAEVANASNTVDDSDFGGTAGVGLSLDTSNVFTIFNKIVRKLRERNIDVTGLDPRLDMKAAKAGGYGGMSGFGAFSPYFFSVLEEAEQNRETSQGDRYGMNGYVKTRGSLDLMLTNNSYWTGQLNIATNPTNGDTVVINGVTFTFVSTIGTAAGNVLIAGTAAGTVDNLVALINAPGTTTANGVALSATRSNQYTLSDREKIEDITAVDGTTYVTIQAEGAGYLVVSEVLTDATDGWSKEVQHNLAGKKGCIDMVAQSGPGVETSLIEDGFGTKVKPYILYGKKSFLEGTFRMVDVLINTANLT